MNKYIKKIKSRLAAVLVLVGCFAVIAVTSDYSSPAVMTSAAVTQRRTIVLDAGHGGEDGGCVGINGEIEKDINFAIVRNVSDMLTASGFDVVLTRTGDEAIYDKGVTGLRNKKVSDMKNRLEIINSYENCIFLSVHQNQFTEPEYFGAQIFYNENNADNKLLAQIMQDNFRVIQPDNDREIKLSGEELYLFHNTDNTAVLIECGFLSNPDDAARLSDVGYQRKVAFIIYNGIVRYLQTTYDSDAA